MNMADNPLKKCNKCVPMVHSFQKDGSVRMGVILKYFKQRKASSFQELDRKLIEPRADFAYFIKNAPCIIRFIPTEFVSHPLTTVVFDENNFPTITEVSIPKANKQSSTVAAVVGKTVWFTPATFGIPDPIDNPLHPKYRMKIKNMEGRRMPINRLPSMYGWIQIVPNQYFHEELLAGSVGSAKNHRFISS